MSTLTDAMPCPVRHMTKPTLHGLMEMWGKGRAVSLIDVDDAMDFTGLIYGIKVADGYVAGESPTLFYVDLYTERGVVRNILVDCEDGNRPIRR